MRTNGFQKPYNNLQITTWALFPLFLTGFFLLVPFSLPCSLAIPLSILFSLLVVGSIYYGHLACSIDPIDRHLSTHLYVNNGKGRTKGGPGRNFCWVCQVHCDKSSKHCRFCEKCVDGFDHHCQWLNTCVGRKNYEAFFRAVKLIFGWLFVEVLCFVLVLVGWYVEVEAEAGGDSSFMNVRTNVESSSIPQGKVFVCLVYLWLGVSGFTWLSVVQLLLFHMNLRREGITTYEYIVRDGKRKREAEELEKKKKAEAKAEAKAKAKAENGGQHELVSQEDPGTNFHVEDARAEAEAENERRARAEAEDAEAEAEAEDAMEKGEEMSTTTKNGKHDLVAQEEEEEEAKAEVEVEVNTVESMDTEGENLELKSIQVRVTPQNEAVL